MNKNAFLQGYFKRANTESDVSDQERSTMDPSSYAAGATGGREDVSYVSGDHAKPGQTAEDQQVDERPGNALRGFESLVTPSEVRPSPSTPMSSDL